MNKVCLKCCIEKPVEEFRRRKANKDGRVSSCKPCEKIAEQGQPSRDPETRKRYFHNHYLKHREKVCKRESERAILANFRRKQEVLAHYGNGKIACVKCGYSDIDALSIDHIYDNGAAERKIIGKSGHQMYKWLIDHDYPEGYQTLCMNCNFKRKHEKFAKRRDDLLKSIGQKPKQKDE